MTGDITSLLKQWRGGDDDARDRLVAVLYPELRALAERQLRGERSDHTLQPTALVSEAYLRLSGLDRMDWQDRAHFVHMAARVMRGAGRTGGQDSGGAAIEGVSGGLRLIPLSARAASR